MEAKKAFETFSPEGWWYDFSDFIDAEKQYLKDLSDIGIHDHELNILWFDKNFAPK